MENWVLIAPSDYNGTKNYYEINELGEVRIIHTKKLIKLGTRNRYKLNQCKIRKNFLIDKYINNFNLNEYEQLKDFPNYLIDRSGNIYSLNMKKLLKPQLKNGYHHLRLTTDNGVKTVSIHRLVAQQFIQNPRNYAVVNHRDGNRINNSIDNLEWCSQIYNSQTENTIRKLPQIKYEKYYSVIHYENGKVISKTFKTEEEAINFNNFLKEVKWNRQAKHYLVEQYLYSLTHNKIVFRKSSKEIKVVVDYKYNIELQIKYCNKFKQLINLK